MTKESRTMAGAILITVPTIVFGGFTLLTMLTYDPSYQANALRQDFWRAGHAHAGVLIILSLVNLRYVDEARLSEAVKWFVRISVPLAAILMPLAFFLSVLSPEAREPNAMLNLAYLGALLVAGGTLALGFGLVRSVRL